MWGGNSKSEGLRVHGNKNTSWKSPLRHFMSLHMALSSIQRNINFPVEFVLVFRTKTFKLGILFASTYLSRTDLYYSFTTPSLFLENFSSSKNCSFL